MNPWDAMRQPVAQPKRNPVPIAAPNYAPLTRNTPGWGLAGMNLQGVNAARQKAASQAIPMAQVQDFERYIGNRYGGNVPPHLKQLAQAVRGGQGMNGYSVAAAMEQDAVLNPAPKRHVVTGPAGSGIYIPNVSPNTTAKTGIHDVDSNIWNLTRSGIPARSAYLSQQPGIDYARMLATTKKKYGGEKDMAPAGPGLFGLALGAALPTAGLAFGLGSSGGNIGKIGRSVAGYYAPSPLRG